MLFIYSISILLFYPNAKAANTCKATNDNILWKKIKFDIKMGLGIKSLKPNERAFAREMKIKPTKYRWLGFFNVHFYYE